MSAVIDGKVTFIQHHLPAIEAGSYRLTVAQELQVGSAGDTFAHSVRFAVTGERFRIDPADIDSVFPPANSQGEFVNVLPHVTFSRKILPWERTPLRRDAFTGNLKDDVPSWLALLVFDNQDPAPKLTDSKVLDLVGAPIGKLPADTVSYPDLNELEYGEKWDDLCQTIDIPIELFNAVAPTIDELKWLAHARQVSAEKKADGGDTDYSVIIANRLSTMGRKSTAHLVSLETMSDCLPDSAGTQNPKLPAATKQIRLVSLLSWSFDAISEKLSFSTLLEAIDSGPLRMPAAKSAARTPADKLVDNAAAMGYVALNHHLREGGRTVSWYRGPLVPYATRRTVSTPIDSPDAATRYDPSTGMFDVSYSVAWQLGRLLGLQSQDFSADLYKWKAASRKDTVARFEQQLFQERIGSDPGDALKSVLRPSTAARAPRAAKTRATLSAVLSDPRQIATLHEDQFDAPGSVIDWFARARLLKGVPYNHLVPDERVLPPESIRFFQVDFDWLDCLSDGAYSLGRVTSGDAVHDRARAPALLAGAEKRSANLRAGATGDAPQTITGFLLRSAVVTGWPGIEATAYGGDSRLRILRFERLSPSILICLFDGVVTRLDLHEPPEGLHFGLDKPEGPIDPRTFFKQLRDVRGDSVDATVPIHYRAAGRQVVQIDALAGEIRTKLAPDVFTAAEFALEMIEGVDLVSFEVGGS